MNHIYREICNLKLAIKDLIQADQNLQVQINRLVEGINETRQALDKLGEDQSKEWMAELKIWLSKEKLDELRKAPR